MRPRSLARGTSPAPPAVIEGLLADQITEDAILRFEDDWAAARRALTATP